MGLEPVEALMEALMGRGRGVDLRDGSGNGMV